MTALKNFKELNKADVEALTPLQRILMVTDGTLTEILEAYFLEPIQLIKLSQQIIGAAASHAAFEPNVQEMFLERKILLRGSNSQTTYVYAESIIAFGRLPSSLRDALLHSDVPLGRLWLQHKLETFKELMETGRRSAGNLCHHFGCDASSLLLTRTYRVITNTKPVMIISEYFPAE